MTTNLIPNRTATEPWNLEGNVIFRGKPCNPNSTSYRVPPCSGPYPDYEIIVYLDGNYESKEKVIVTKTKTDMQGKYKTFLNAGKYVIYTKAGMFPSSIKANDFEISEEKNTKLDLVVDTGIR